MDSSIDCDNVFRFMGVEDLGADNAFMLLTQARLFDEPQLAALCLENIDKNTAEALAADGFTDVDIETLRAVLERDTLCIQEAKLFQAVVRWATAECSRQQLPVTPVNQRTVLGSVLDLVRFPLMSVEEFASSAAQSGLLTDREVVSLFLYFTVNPKPTVSFQNSPRCSMTGKEQTVNTDNVSRFMGVEECMDVPARQLMERHMIEALFAHMEMVRGLIIALRFRTQEVYLASRTNNERSIQLRELTPPLLLRSQASGSRRGSFSSCSSVSSGTSTTSKKRKKYSASSDGSDPPPSPSQGNLEFPLGGFEPSTSSHVFHGPETFHQIKHIFRNRFNLLPFYQGCAIQQRRWIDCIYLKKEDPTAKPTSEAVTEIVSLPEVEKNIQETTSNNAWRSNCSDSVTTTDTSVHSSLSNSCSVGYQEEPPEMLEACGGMDDPSCSSPRPTSEVSPMRRKVSALAIARKPRKVKRKESSDCSASESSSSRHSESGSSSHETATSSCSRSNSWSFCSSSSHETATSSCSLSKSWSFCSSSSHETATSSCSPGHSAAAALADTLHPAAAALADTLHPAAASLADTLHPAAASLADTLHPAAAALADTPHPAAAAPAATRLAPAAIPLAPPARTNLSY